MLTLKSAYFSQSLSSQQTELQLTVRGASEWLIKDLRKASVSEINKNDPSSTYLKFNLGNWDEDNGCWNIGSAYIEYSYDSDAKKLTRIYSPDGVNTVTLDFDNISEDPFDTSLLISNKKIMVDLEAGKSVKGQYISYGLVSYVKIRNDYEGYECE